MASRIFITGATGFIGRQLTRDLVAAGHAVRILARTPQKARTLFAALGDAVEIEEGDLLNPATLDRACAGIETIYHIAGLYRFGLRHRKQVWAANVEGVENLLQSAAKSEVAKVVHVSSGGVLRADPRSLGRKTLLDETDFPQTPPPFSSYKYSKWHAEQRVLAWAKRGFPVTIASATCPIGAGDELPTPTGRLILDFLQGDFPCYCRTGLNFANVADLSAGLQRVAEAGRPGERYLLGHHNLWLKPFLDLLAEETGLPAPTFQLPQPLVWAAGAAGEVIDLLRLSKKPARICLETAFYAGLVQFFSNAKAREELGWSPVTPLRQSVREAVTWYQKGLMPAPVCPGIAVAQP